MAIYIVLDNDGDAFQVTADDAYPTRCDSGVTFVDADDKTLLIVYDVKRVTRVSKTDLKVVK